jgi:hypothetical protein
MLESVRLRPAVELNAKGYLDDFWWHSEKGGGDFWKLERIQHFREPDEPSWVAMNEGDWARALALIEEKRAASKHHVTVNEHSGSHRVRVVERPVTPYLQWEMQLLKIWVETGAQNIRVLDASAVRHLETGGPLPELVILGTTAMYEVLYDDTGTHAGGRRIDDADVIIACRQQLKDLYCKGEDLLTYFEREIAELPPPHTGG